MDVLDDPQDSLKKLTDVIATYAKTLAEHNKDKKIEVSEKPTVYYIKHHKDFSVALGYYNDLLNKYCPGDDPRELSDQIRQKRDKYYSNLAKLIHGLNFD